MNGIDERQEILLYIIFYSMKKRRLHRARFKYFQIESLTRSFSCDYRKLLSQ